MKPLCSEALSLKCIQCQALALVREDKEVAQANMGLRPALMVRGPRGPRKNVDMECSVETISNYYRLHTPVACKFVLFIGKVHSFLKLCLQDLHFRKTITNLFTTSESPKIRIPIVQIFFYDFFCLIKSSVNHSGITKPFLNPNIIFTSNCLLQNH